MENKVIDSRMNKEGDIIRRRRECLSCSDRFTTYERLEKSLPFVVKKDGRTIHADDSAGDRLKIRIFLARQCFKGSHE